MNDLLKQASFLGAFGKFFRPSVTKMTEPLITKTTKPLMQDVINAEGMKISIPQRDISGNPIHIDEMKSVEKEMVTPSMFQQIAFPAAALAGTGMVGKELIYDPIMQRRREKTTLESLRESTPQLEGVDDKVVKDYFGVIQTFAPKAATNPLVAGALVNKMVQFEGVDSNLVKDLTQIQGDSRGGYLNKLIEGGVAAGSAAMAG